MHLSSNTQSSERFDREAEAISSLSHPHICPPYDVGHQDGIDFLVMEYLKGEALARRLRKRGASAGAGVRIRYSDHRRVGYSAPAWGDSPRPEIREHHAHQDRAALSY